MYRRSCSTLTTSSCSFIESTIVRFIACMPIYRSCSTSGGDLITSSIRGRSCSSSSTGSVSYSSGSSSSIIGAPSCAAAPRGHRHYASDAPTRSKSNDSGDASRRGEGNGVGEEVVLPQTNHYPTQSLEFRSSFHISTAIVSDLLRPPSRIPLGNRKVLRTSMPVAAIDKYANFALAKYEIGRAAQRGLRPRIDTIAKPHAVQHGSQRALGCCRTTRIRLHYASHHGGRRLRSPRPD